jgi:hypothetical protein
MGSAMRPPSWTSQISASSSRQIRSSPSPQGVAARHRQDH